MKIFYFVTLILLVVFSSYCQKEITSVDIPITSGNSDNYYVSKIYLIDSTALPEDTMVIVTFKYDNLKRVIELSDSSKGAGTNNFFGATITYFYNGNDLRPYKSRQLDYAVTDTVDVYSFYDLMNRKVKDSSLTRLDNPSINYYLVNLKVTNYSYAPGYGYAQTRDTDLVNNAIQAKNNTFDTAVVDVSNNTLSSIHNDGGLITRSEIYYTDHKNVFHNLNIFKNYVNFLDYDTNILFSTGNNPLLIILSLTGAAGSTTSHDVTYDYSYNANGNVHESVYVYDYTASGYFKNIYEYVKL